MTICTSFTYNMAAKTSCIVIEERNYVCHPMYTNSNSDCHHWAVTLAAEVVRLGASKSSGRRSIRQCWAYATAVSASANQVHIRWCSDDPGWCDNRVSVSTECPDLGTAAWCGPADESGSASAGAAPALHPLRLSVARPAASVAADAGDAGLGTALWTDVRVRRTMDVGLDGFCSPVTPPHCGVTSIWPEQGQKMTCWKKSRLLLGRGCFGCLNTTNINPSYSICCCTSVLSVLWRCWLGGRKGIRPKKTE